MTKHVTVTIVQLAFSCWEDILTCTRLWTEGKYTHDYVLIGDLQIAKKSKDYSLLQSKNDNIAQETVGHMSTADVQKLANKCKMEEETTLPYCFLS